jgi:nudix-type nucleoside diphosphatase (YffH/AdpP family)
MSLITIEKAEKFYDGWSKCYLLHLLDRHGKRRTYQIEDHGAVACVLPYDPQRKVAILVYQVRPPLIFAGETERLYEAPAGVIETEGAEECARREALEEAGVAVTALEYLGSFWVSPGISTERSSIYLAPYSIADRVTEGGGLAAEHEDIEVHELPLSRLAEMADSFQISCMKTFIAIQALRQRRPDLFVA